MKSLKTNFSRSSRNFGEDLEDPRSDRIYSSGNRGVKKGPGPRGTRDEEFLVPSLVLILVCCTFFFHKELSDFQFSCFSLALTPTVQSDLLKIPKYCRCRTVRDSIKFMLVLLKIYNRYSINDNF